MISSLSNKRSPKANNRYIPVSIRYEAELLCYAKDKTLHKFVKGLSAPVVREAFGWDEDFMQIDLNAYPQEGRSASGMVDG